MQKLDSMADNPAAKVVIVIVISKMYMESQSEYIPAFELSALTSLQFSTHVDSKKTQTPSTVSVAHVGVLIQNFQLGFGSTWTCPSLLHTVLCAHSNLIWPQLKRNLLENRCFALFIQDW